MKVAFGILLVLFVSCKTKQSQAISNFQIEESIVLKTLNCPENGICTIELIPNKTIDFKTDEFGIVYPLISDGEKIVLKYTYKKIQKEQIPDGHYSEVIYAEFDKNISEISLTDYELQNSKLHFGRFCFCKGDSGYFPVKKGSFVLTKISNDSLNIHINFNLKRIPQIVSEINETVSLKSNETN